LSLTRHQPLTLPWLPTSSTLPSLSNTLQSLVRIRL
jgi:hypothetical protein